MNKKLIIFDMDGTLVNSSITIANAINYVRKNLGFKAMDPEQILRMVNDHTLNPAKTFYHADAFDSDHERWFSEYYSQHHDKELALYSGITALLNALKDTDHILAVATNAYRISTIESLTHLNIYHYFDTIACYDDVEKGKPYPDMLHKILNELNHKKEDTIFIGDGPRDEMASKNAGISYIMVDWGFTEHDNAVCSVEALHDLLLK